MLPDTKLPAGTPCFLASGHGFELRDVAGNFAPTTGHSRKRRIFTVTPRIQSVSLLLEHDEMVAVHEFFENDLLAGSLPFSAFVMTEGGVPMWWEAMFIEPFTTSAMPLGRFRLNARLLLTGEPSIDGPGRSSFAGRIGIPALGSATPTVGRPLSGRVTIAADGTVSDTYGRKLSGRITLPDTSSVPAAYDRRLAGRITVVAAGGA